VRCDLENYDLFQGVEQFLLEDLGLHRLPVIKLSTVAQRKPGQKIVPVQVQRLYKDWLRWFCFKKLIKAGCVNPKVFITAQSDCLTIYLEPSSNRSLVKTDKYLAQPCPRPPSVTVWPEHCRQDFSAAWIFVDRKVTQQRQCFPATQFDQLSIIL
jgi:hypothetical protein